MVWHGLLSGIKPILADNFNLSVDNFPEFKETGLESCTIRVVAETDLDAILQIEKECYPLPWSFQQFVEELENPVATLLVGEIENRIVGYICYWLVVGEMEILNLATAAEFRRKGIAAELMTQAFNRCPVDKLSSAWLEVRAANQSAIALYRRSGFNQSGVRKGYYRDGEDAIVMVKIFNQQKSQEQN